MRTPEQSQSPWMSVHPAEALPLEGNASADVCVIGAGIAGMTAAYLAAKKGKSVIVVDSGPVGGGMTSRTTAHLTNAIDDRYVEIERLHGAQGAKLAAQSHFAAIGAIEAIARHESIDCEFERVDGFLFLPPDGDPDELLREYEAALRAGVQGLEWADRAPIPGIDTGRCLRFPRQGQFHPLKYLGGLARALRDLGGRIHTGVHVADVNDGERAEVLTRGGRRIDCGAAIVATNAPINDRVALHTKLAVYLTYVVAARIPRGSVERALFWDTPEPYHYARLLEPAGEHIIVGGEDHKQGQADDAERRFANLELWLRERFPTAREITHRWSGQVRESLDGLAYIGRNPGDSNVFVVAGDSGMGITHGTIAGILLADLVNGVSTPWAELYDPGRVNLKAARTYAAENANMAWQFSDWVRAGNVDSVESIPAGSGAVVRRGVHKIAAYRDAMGALHERSARCPHLGCTVAWNPAENTWDCKCHGSRFDAYGKPLCGPAVDPLPEIESHPGEPPSPSPPSLPPLPPG